MPYLESLKPLCLHFQELAFLDKVMHQENLNK